MNYIVPICLLTLQKQGGIMQISNFQLSYLDFFFCDQANKNYWKKNQKSDLMQFGLKHHLSHLSPPVLSLQLMQAPVLWSHVSACPLHWQGRQLGKPQWPAWHPSQRWPNAPGRHWQWPVNLSQSRVTEPSKLQPQAAQRGERDKEGHKGSRGAWLEEVKWKGEGIKDREKQDVE